MYNPLVSIRIRARRIPRMNFKDTGETMLIQKLRSALLATFAGLLLLVLCQNAMAQNQSQPAGKPAAKKKTNAESCDGALDIVPVKSATFTRKRRPSKSEESKPADTKSENQREKPARQEKSARG